MTKPPLAQTPLERSVFDYEQALICAGEAFYRFAGSVLGEVGRRHKLTGQDTVVFQQLMFAAKPRGVAELSRFANRDDVANIQYSLRKLVAAGLIEKTPGSSNRDTAYQPTAGGRALTAEIVAVRRDHLMSQAEQVRDVEGRLADATSALTLLTGFYDHVSRVMAGRDDA